MDLKEILGEELYKQVTEKLGDKKIMIDDGNFIPKSRFNEVNEAKKELDKLLKERDVQLEQLSKNNKDSEELTKQIKDLQALNKQTADEYENKINKMQFDYALDGALTGAKCKNIKALKALLDIENIKYQDGKLEGLEDQLKTLKESDSYLFDIESNPGSKGFNPGGGNQTITKEDFNKMGYSERVKLYSENRELYNNLNQ